MPFYEVSVITRSLSKVRLDTVLKKKKFIISRQILWKHCHALVTLCLIMEQSSKKSSRLDIVTCLTNGWPNRRMNQSMLQSKIDFKNYFSSSHFFSFFLFKAHMSREARQKTKSILLHDLDTVNSSLCICKPFSFSGSSRSDSSWYHSATEGWM